MNPEYFGDPTGFERYKRESTAANYQKIKAQAAMVNKFMRDCGFDYTEWATIRSLVAQMPAVTGERRMDDA